MRIRRFNENVLIYDVDWHTILPKEIEIILAKKVVYKLGNVMKHSDMVQVTYSHDEWSVPSNLEFDFYFLNNGHIKMDVDITLGDKMVSEFSIEKPNKISLIQYTSTGSKFDPSNTFFALSNKSISDFVQFLNRFDGFMLKEEDLKFLNKDYKN